MTRILQSSWFLALVGCLLYLGTTVVLLRPEQFASAAPAAAAEEVHTSAGNDPSWRFRNPEFEQWVEELKHEKETLALREQQLRELQARLDAERQEILTVTQAVFQLQSEFEKNVTRIKEQQVDNLKRQSKILAGMSPEGAAAMLGEASEGEAVRMLFTLKPDAASLILDTMSKLGRAQAQRAATLAERLRLVLPPTPNNSRPASPG